MVGAGRRLATELVVISARATHEIHAAAGARVRAVSLTTGGLAGTPAAVMAAAPARQSRASFAVASSPLPLLTTRT